jgi:hypothetical protein
MSYRDQEGPRELLTRADVIDLSAALITVMLLVTNFTDMIGVPRVLAALIFTFFVPGRAVVGNWPRMADWAGVAMSIVLSLGLMIFLATLMLWMKLWHPLGLFEFEALFSLIGLGVAITRRRLSFNAF